MRFMCIAAYIAVSGLGLIAFQNCSQAKFADINVGSLEQSSLSASTITINNNALYTNDTNVRVQIEMDKPLQMYVTNDPTCVNGGLWQPYSKEISWVLGDKNKGTSVYVKFKSEYTESACSSDDIIHDDIAPLIAVDKPVAAVTNAAAMSFVVSASDKGSGIDKMECPTGMSSCSGAVSIANSTEGPQNKVFYAYDKAGNKSLPLTVSWLYDKTGPVIDFNMKPGTYTKDAAANFKMMSTDNYTVSANIKYKYSLDGAAAVDANESFTVNLATEGEHSISVEGYDQAGNKSNVKTYSWKYGKKNPTLQFTKMPKPYDNAKGSFEFTGMDQFNQPLATYECSLNGAAYANCASPVNLAAANLNQGSNNFKVRGTDSLGLQTEIMYSWVYDTVKPVLSWKKFPAKFSRNAAEEVQVNVVETYLEHIDFIIDGTAYNTAMVAAYMMNNLTEGRHSVRVIAYDQAGNASIPLEDYFWSDFTRPVVNPINVTTPTKYNNVNIPVSATDNNTDPANTIALQYAVDASMTFNPFVSPIALSGLSDGTHYVKVYATDAAGNQSLTVQSNNFVVDTSPPMISFLKQPPMNVGYVPGASNTVVVKFDVYDMASGINTYTCGMTISGVSQTGVPCMANTDLTISTAQLGDYVYSVRAIDMVGWMSTKSVSWTVMAQYVSGTTTFNITQVENNKVDVLLVVDNSGSMDNEQTNLSTAFSNFTNNLAGLDWRVAITTTDKTSGGQEGKRGKLIKFGTATGAPYYIDANTVSGTALLQQYIVQGTNGDGDEKGLTNIQLFIDRILEPSPTLNLNEKGFYRPDAILATIVISDSDEAENSSSVYSNSDVYLNGNTSGTVRGVYTKLPGKTYIHHSIIALPGDRACKDLGETYGLSYYNVSLATEGIATSICEPNYGAKLTEFATNIVTKVSSKTLPCAPVDSNADGNLDVSVIYTSGAGVSSVLDPSLYTVSGKTIRFKNALSATGTYKVDYICLAF